MLAPRETVEKLIESIGKIEIAATNSPRAVTVVGPADSLEALTKAATARGIAALDLNLDYPFHSTFMTPIKERLIAALQDILPQPGHIPLISSVTGTVLSGSRFGANYWWRNIREPIQFLAAIREAAALGARCFIEVGPRPMLLKHIADGLEGVTSNVATQSVLDCNDQDRDPIPAAVCKAIVSGARIETTEVFGPDPGAAIPLPSYPWQQAKFHFSPHGRSCRHKRNEQHPMAGGVLPRMRWHGTATSTRCFFPNLPIISLATRLSCRVRRSLKSHYL